MNGANFPCDRDAGIISDLVSGGISPSDSDAGDAGIGGDLVNAGNFVSNSDATIVSENSVNSDNAMIGDNVEDVVVDKYDEESYFEISEDCFSADDS